MSASNARGTYIDGCGRILDDGGSIYTRIGYAREAAPDLVIDSEFQTVIVPCHPDRRTFP